MVHLPALKGCVKCSVKFCVTRRVTTSMIPCSTASGDVMVIAGPAVVDAFMMMSVSAGFTECREIVNVLFLKLNIAASSFTCTISQVVKYFIAVNRVEMFSYSQSGHFTIQNHTNDTNDYMHYQDYSSI